jgi:hypothetical protein
VDWKPERAVQAKVRDFSKKNKQKKWLLKHTSGRTLRVGLQNGDFFQILLVNNGLYPQEAFVATLCLTLPRQRLDWFTIISSPRKFVECLCCDVSPPPVLPVLSRFIKSPVIYTSYSHTNYIHTFIHSYIHTLILSHIHTFIHTQHIHNIIHT